MGGEEELDPRRWKQVVREGGSGLRREFESQEVEAGWRRGFGSSRWKRVGEEGLDHGRWKRVGGGLDLRWKQVEKVWIQEVGPPEVEAGWSRGVGP